MKKVLVTFASKHQATAEIADTIADILRQKGLSAISEDVDYVTNLEEFDAVLVGSAVYAGQWLTKAEKFLRANVKMLSAMPVWLFSSGPTGEGDPVELLNGWKFPENLAPLMLQINPKEIVLFSGRIDMETLNLGERIIVKAVRGKTGDFRDWEHIEHWAERVADEILSIEALEA